MRSSGLGGPRIGGLRVLILVLPINHRDIAKSLAGVDKKKIAWTLRLYGVIYFHSQIRITSFTWVFFWVTDFGLYLGFESYMHRSCVYTNRYIVLLLQRFCSTMPWQALGLVLMLKTSADTSKHVRFYSLFRVVSDFSPLCLTKQAWRVAWKTPRVPARVNVSSTRHSRVLPSHPNPDVLYPPFTPDLHVYTLAKKGPNVFLTSFIFVSKLSSQACFGEYLMSVWFVSFLFTVYICCKFGMLSCLTLGDHTL